MGEPRTAQELEDEYQRWLDLPLGATRPCNSCDCGAEVTFKGQDTTYLHATYCPKYKNPHE